MHSKLVCRNYKSGDYIIWHTKKDDHIYVLWNQASHHLCEEYSCKQLEASILAWHGPIDPCFRPGWAGLVNHRHEKHQAILAQPDRPAEPGQTHILCTFLILSFLTFIKLFCCCNLAWWAGQFILIPLQALSISIYLIIHLERR